MIGNLQYYENVKDITENIEDPNILGGFVYILKTNDAVKIGKSRMVAHRISEIERTSGRRITKICVSPACGNYAAIENQLHKQFKPYRILSEWYTTSFDNVVRELEQMQFTDLDIKEGQTLESDPLFSFLFDPLPDLQNVLDVMIKADPIVQDYLKSNNLRLVLYGGRVYITDDDLLFMQIDEYAQFIKAVDWSSQTFKKGRKS